ncbi:hypothetical protein Tco_1028177, partial [Tanacetum coccineum]
MNIKIRGGLLGLKRLYGFLEVTAAQVHNGNYAKWFGINKWYQSFALRNFDLEDIEFESTNSGTTAKLPILKLGEYEMWVIRIKQYFQIQDYALWEVIENGDSWVSVPQTTQENATKKTQKTLLKQQYENFSATSAESLDSIFNRLQKIVSRLAILGAVIAQEDLNLNFLSSLLVKKSVGASSGAQNLAFMTTPSTSSTNDANTASPQVSTASPNVNAASPQVSTASPNVNAASPQVSTASVSDNTVYAFMVENTNGSNVLHQDLEKIHEDDFEAMDLKWQLSFLSVRAKKYYQRTGKKIFINA